MSTRLGKLTHRKLRGPIYYGHSDGHTCGHQHSTLKGAQHCINRLSGKWTIKQTIPGPRASDGTYSGRIDVA